MGLTGSRDAGAEQMRKVGTGVWRERGSGGVERGESLRASGGRMENGSERDGKLRLELRWKDEVLYCEPAKIAEFTSPYSRLSHGTLAGVHDQTSNSKFICPLEEIVSLYCMDAS